MKDDTTMPSDTATASVSSPVLIPERPTLYQCVYPEPLARIGWMTSAPADDREFFNMSQYPPGSVLVTLPGSTPPPAKEPKSNHTPAQPGEECAGCGVCEPAPTPKAEPKPIPWPSDLSTLVGKRITTAALEGRFIGAYKEPLLVTKIWPADHLESPWIEATAADGVEGSISLSHRILLSIEDAEPKPAPPQSEDWRSLVEQFVAAFGVLIGQGPDSTIPRSKTIDTPLGIPVKIGELMYEARAALAKAPPPPNVQPSPAPFAPLPEWWRPEGVAADLTTRVRGIPDAQTQASEMSRGNMWRDPTKPGEPQHAKTHYGLLCDGLIERDRQWRDLIERRDSNWLTEVNRLRRELHDQQKGKSRPSDPPAQQESKP